MTVAVTGELYCIISRPIDEHVGQAIGITEGRTTVSLREICGEAAESLAGTMAASLAQIEAAFACVQEATLTRVDEAFKARPPSKRRGPTRCSTVPPLAFKPNSNA